MNFLLDTHVWIWSQEIPEKLGPKTRSALSDGQNGVWLSPISTLEIARLVSQGVIELSGSLTSWVEESGDSLRARTIELSHEIAIRAYALDAPIHRDPADRILVATAAIRDLTLLTADERILSYAHVDSWDARL